MLITAILGSPHGFKGNTSVLASWLLWEAEQAGAKIMGISLGDYDIRPCLGCEACQKSEACPVDDDFNSIIKAVENSDGIVLVSPMHFFGCSASMKTFIERSRSILLRQQWAGKYGAVVMTSGDTGCGKATRTLLGFLQAAGCWTVGSVHAMVSSWQDEDQRRQPFRDACALGLRLTRAIRQQQVFEEQRPVIEAYGQHLQCMNSTQIFTEHGKRLAVSPLLHEVTS